MEETVVLYRFGETDGGVAIASLEAAGFRVVAPASLTELHNLLHSTSCAAVVVPESEFSSRGIDPARHLANAMSPHVLILIDGNGRGRVVRAGATGSRTADAAGARAARVLELLERIAEGREIGDDSGATPSARSPGPRDIADLLASPLLADLPRKPRAILELLASSPDGTETGEIAFALWGGEARDRRRDVQAYVSLLRARIAPVPRPRVRIARRGTRYALEAADTKKPGPA